MNSQLPLWEAVKQRLEEQEQTKQQQERRAARDRNQEELRHDNFGDDNSEGEGVIEKFQSGGAGSNLCRVEVRGARPPPCLLTWRGKKGWRQDLKDGEAQLSAGEGG